MTQRIQPPSEKYHHTAWLAVFFPALLCYIYSCKYPPITNIQTSAGSSSLLNWLSSIELNPTYQAVAYYVQMEGGTTESEIESILYVDKNADNNLKDVRREQLALRHPMEVVIQSDDTHKYHLVGTTWVHDIELGRGYLLVSDLLYSGNIWRWEVGGGLITIGRSLFQKESGCRSNLWSTCPSNSVDSYSNEVLEGSSGIAVESVKDAESFHVGHLLVAEKGERRIVRMEEDGARTPLVIQVPQLCGDDKTRRVVHPQHLVYTAFGDLIFSDSEEHVVVDSNGGEESCIGSFAGVYRVKEAVNIPPISFKESYDAHKLNLTGTSVELLFSSNLEHISAISHSDDVLNSIFIGGRMVSTDGEKRHVVLKLDVGEDESDDESVEPEQSQRRHGILDDKGSKVFFDMTSFFAGHKGSDSTAVAVDGKGNIYAGYPGGIAIIDRFGELLSTIPFVEGSDVQVPNSISLGHDGYLYATVKDKLLRLRLKTSPPQIPTNLIVPSRKHN